MIRLKIEVLKLFLLEFVWDRKNKSKENLADEVSENLPADSPTDTK
jgi:hypothetical protein